MGGTALCLELKNLGFGDGIAWPDGTNLGQGNHHSQIDEERHPLHVDFSSKAVARAYFLLFDSN